MADFRREIARIAPEHATLHSLNHDHQTVFEQTSAVDLADLRAVLTELRTPPARFTLMLGLIW